MKGIDGAPKGSVFASVRWNVVGQMISRIIQLVVSVILARLLAPEDFGLMAMAMVLIGFMEIFYELGTSSAIIQRTEINQTLLSSLFYINIVFGALLGLLFVSTGTLIAELYQDARVAPILQVLGFVFVLSSLGLVHHALLRRRMQFDRLNIIGLIVVIFDGGTAVILAYWGWSVWALVYSVLVNRLVFIFLLYLALPWRPQFVFSWTEVNSVMHFIANLTGSKTFNYFSRNSDKFIIGKFLGASSLGFYSQAFKLITYPIDFVNATLGSVLFPALSRLENNQEFRVMYLRACGAIALITFPIFVGMGTLAEPFILVVYGAKWQPSIPLLILLTPLGMIQAILGTVYYIYVAKGRTDRYLYWTIISGVTVAVGFLCGLPWGLTGVTAAYVIAITILGIFGFWMPFRLIDLKTRDFIRTLLPYMLNATVMGISMMLLRWGLSSFGVGQIWVLAGGVCFGFVIYAGLTLWIKPAAFIDLIRLIPNQIQKHYQLHKWTNSETVAKIEGNP